MAETVNSYVLGRGTISIDGRYIGNSPSIMFLERIYEKGVRILFATENMSQENRDLYFAAQNGELEEKRFVIDYKAHNPRGPNTDFHFGRVKLVAGTYELKGEVWQNVQFIGELERDEDGNNFTMTERPEEKPDEKDPYDRIVVAAIRLCASMSEEQMHEMVSSQTDWSTVEQAECAAAFLDLGQAVQDYQGSKE